MVIYGCVVIMKSECACVHEAKILTYHTYVPKHTLVGVEFMDLKLYFLLYWVQKVNPL